MLSPSDAAVVRRDPALPGLSLLLDSEAFTELLRRSVPGRQLGPAVNTYVRYKPATSCLAAFRLGIDQVTADVYAKVYRHDAKDKLRNALRSVVPDGPPGSTSIILEDLALMISFFPHDMQIRSLTRLAEPDTRERLLGRVFRRQPELREGTLRGLGYKPERRFVGQLTCGGEPRAVVKFYADDQYASAKRGSKGLLSRGPLRIAQRIGRSNRHHVLAFEWIKGVSLNEAIMQAEWPAGESAHVGAALAELHSQSPEHVERLTRDAEVRAIVALAEAPSVLCPHLSKQAHELTSRLAKWVASQPPARQLVHGDFYANQVLLDGKTVVILDLDEAVYGDPAADLGNFIAHLEWSALRGDLTARQSERVRDALLDGYRNASKNGIPSNVELYTAIGLLRLAQHPFRSRSTDWAEQTEAILESARGIVERAIHGDTLPRSPLAARRAFSDGAEAVTVDDPYQVMQDPALQFLERALDPTEVQSDLERSLPHLADGRGFPSLRAIRVTRHKPGRRCSIEYDLEFARSPGRCEVVTLVGKARAKGLNVQSFHIHSQIREAGFQDEASDGVSVPETLGVVPPLGCWFQRKVEGIPATKLMEGAEGVTLATRIAEAIYKLHRTDVQTSRSHTILDELEILHKRVPCVARDNPHWTDRIRHILKACERLADTIPATDVAGIHRDFYSDHVIVDGGRLYLLDFDLFCQGDPGLDIGNFIGHLTEQSLRTRNSAEGLRRCEEALEERYVELAGESIRDSIRAYTTLTLVRHIYLSTQFPERRATTEPLLELCEQRLAVG